MPKSIVIKDNVTLTFDDTTYAGQLRYDPEFKMLWLEQDRTQPHAGPWSVLAISREEPYNADDDTVAILGTDAPNNVVDQLVKLGVGTMVSEGLLAPDYTRLRILRINPELLAAAA